jgi:hypothetical protein
MSDQLSATENATDATGQTSENQAQGRTYTQDEFDNHMAGLKSSITKKFERQFEELGDIGELKKLKSDAEKRSIDEATKRGEFDKVMLDLAAKKDAEIHKRDEIIREYKVNSPLLDSAAKFKSVNPNQVKQLLSSQVTLNEYGDTQVIDVSGKARYKDDGTPFAVDDLVGEFLKTNPHFASATPSTAHTQSNDGSQVKGDFDLSKLDMKNPAHRQKYKQAKDKGLI